MSENINLDNKNKIKNKQYLLFALSIIALISICILILLAGGKDNLITAKNNKEQIVIEDITKGAKSEDRWLEHSESKLNNLAIELSETKEQNKKLQTMIDSLADKLSKKNLADEESLKEYKNNQEEYLKQITLLQEDLKKHPEFENKSSNQLENNNNLTDPFASPDANKNNTLARSSKIETIDVKLSGVKDNKNSIFNSKDYLPAGSYAQAVIISGVDASVGINSQTDPRPILFRVTSKAISAAKNNIKQETDITGCIVTGAAYGDLSSEKIFARLLKMTCAASEDEISEIEVKGYVAGLGRAGVRGFVVSREGDLVSKSFMAGLVGGLGEGVSERLTNPSLLNGGFAVEQPSNKSVIGKGVGKGFSKSSDRLADYLINRAEQYQPVITIGAGLKVELVFQEGVKITHNLDNKKEKADAL